MDKQMELLIELCKEQAHTLRSLNQVMFDTTKEQRDLPDEERNADLLDFAWSSNDCIADNPKQANLLKTLKEEYGIVI